MSFRTSLKAEGERCLTMKYYKIHKVLVTLCETYGDIKLSDVTRIYKNVKEWKALGLL